MHWRATGSRLKQVMDVVARWAARSRQIFEGRARFPILVRVPELTGVAKYRASETTARRRSGGKPSRSANVADIRMEETPPTVEHEANRRRTFISANVRGRDVASFVAEAQQAVATQVSLPSGYEIRWGGDFENLQSASRRLLLITPIVLLLIFLLLHTTFKSPSLALLIFLAVPMAASGGIFALSCAACRSAFPPESASSLSLESPC